MLKIPVMERALMEHQISKLEFYETPRQATFELLKVLDLDEDDPHVIFEPCSGDNAIKKAIEAFGWRHKVYTNDIDEQQPSKWHHDATKPKFWQALSNSRIGPPTWTISNPPFSQAYRIIPNALKHSTEGVAMLLRLSWLEPTKKRSAFLKGNPPTRLIVLPRISFTGDGRTDSVICAWMIWTEEPKIASGISVVPSL